VEGYCEHGNEPSGSIKCWEDLLWLSDFWLLNKRSTEKVVTCFYTPDEIQIFICNFKFNMYFLLNFLKPGGVEPEVFAFLPQSVGRPRMMVNSDSFNPLCQYLSNLSQWLNGWLLCYVGSNLCQGTFCPEEGFSS
jgi:hypothetical protein